MIKLENITKIYSFKNGFFQALKDVNLIVEQGEFLSIIGASGSGKSTLLNIIGFIDEATSGKYIFKGEDVSKISDDKKTLFRRKEIGFIFQSFNLLPRLNLIENIILPALYLGIDRKIAIKKAKALIEMLDLESKEKNLITDLSGGEKQRTAIARALINSPSLILADEPTGNLDSQNAVGVIDILRNLNKNNKITIIMVTHDMSLIKEDFRVVKIKDGRIDEIN